MNENKRFELAHFLKELRGKKKDLETELKSLNSEIESVQYELIQDMIDNESTGFNYKGHNFSLVIKEYPAAIPEKKDKLYAVMKEKGFEDLFTINTRTLSATVKDLKENNDGILPQWLEGFINIAEKSTIKISKGRKV